MFQEAKGVGVCVCPMRRLLRQPRLDKTSPSFFYFRCKRNDSAKNVGHARGGVVLAAFLKLTPMFLFVMPGVIARSIIPTIDRDPNVRW